MCEQCHRLETIIQGYRKLVQGLDAPTVERINGYIRELERRKETISHPAWAATRPEQHRWGNLTEGDL